MSESRDIVFQSDAREIENMMPVEKCSHDRVFSDGSIWCCADCPAWAHEKSAFDSKYS